MNYWELVNRLLELADQSNWPDDMRADEWRGYSEAMELVHELAFDAQQSEHYKPSR